jgi:hypothetical protein
MLKANKLGGSGCTDVPELIGIAANLFSRAPIHGVVAAL